MSKRFRKTDVLADAIAQRTHQIPGCWIWRGTVKPDGYGYMRWDGREQRAHRLSLQAVGVTPVPDDKMVDHICRNRACVNPAHLRVVNARTNTIENSVSIAAQNASKTHCKSGHELTPENTYISYSKGTRSRDCLICKREAKARYDDHLRTLAAPCPGHQRHLFRNSVVCVRCGASKPPATAARHSYRGGNGKAA